MGNKRVGWLTIQEQVQASQEHDCLGSNDGYVDVPQRQFKLGQDQAAWHEYNRLRAQHPESDFILVHMTKTVLGGNL